MAFPSPGSGPKPYQHQLDNTQYDEILARVKLYRPVQNLEDDNDGTWREGPPSQEMAKLAAYWKDSYDWQKTLKEINSAFSHYAMTIDGTEGYSHPVPMHFLHERSKKDKALPVVLLHGWPSSHMKWSKVIKGLTESHHVVVPDLPGYGFSPAATHSGLNCREMGKVFNKLMKALGYEKYAVVSTDLGWWVGSWMAFDLSENVVGHMTDFFMAIPTESDMARIASGEARDDEKAHMEATGKFMNNNFAYSKIHATKPLMLAQAMQDSPVGYAGWLWSIIIPGSDDYKWSHDELITMTMMLLLQGAYGGLRAYKEFLTHELLQIPKSSVPTGVSTWGYINGPNPEIAKKPLVPRDWIERTVNLQFFSAYEDGGHFPAISKPELWLRDTRQFLGTLTM